MHIIVLQNVTDKCLLNIRAHRIRPTHVHLWLATGTDIGTYIGVIDRYGQSKCIASSICGLIKYFRLLFPNLYYLSLAMMSKTWDLATFVWKKKKWTTKPTTLCMWSNENFYFGVLLSRKHLISTKYIYDSLKAWLKYLENLRKLPFTGIIWHLSSVAMTLYAYASIITRA